MLKTGVLSIKLIQLGQQITNMYMHECMQALLKGDCCNLGGCFCLFFRSEKPQPENVHDASVDLINFTLCK